MQIFSMRLFLFGVLFFTVLNVEAEIKISLARQTGSYPEMLVAIEAASPYRFSYRSNLFEGKGKVQFSANEESIEVLLQRLLEPVAIRFDIRNEVVVLRPHKRTKRTVRDTIRIGAPLDTLVALGEVVVSSNRLGEVTPVYSVQMGKMSISPQTLRQTPTLLGEPDIIKTLQLTPGVAMGTEGVAGLYVRGGGNDENLFLIDGNPVYQINHLGGIFSAFNPEAIGAMDFFKGGFPARYGGRLSSVVDLQTRSGNSDRVKGNMTMGLISGNLNLEGPLFNKKTTFYVGLRRTWLDVLSAPTLAIINHTQKDMGKKNRMRYAFHDLNGKIIHRLDEDNQLFVSIYQGNDVFRVGYGEFNASNQEGYYHNDTNHRMRWGNLMTTVGWDRRYNAQLEGRLTALYTRYRSQLSFRSESQSGRPGDLGYSFDQTENRSTNRIEDMGLRASFNYRPQERHQVRAGADLLYHIFRPEFTRFQQKAQTSTTENGSQPQILSNDRLHGVEYALYAEDDWRLHARLLVNGGIRVSAFTTPGKTFVNAEPRVSIRWLLGSELSMKASYARMAQYVHQLSNSFLNLPTDSWMPVTAKLQPLLSDQVSAGIYYALKQQWQFSMEGYYKKLHNLLDYKDGFSFMPGTAEWESKLTTGRGNAYGMEWMVRKENGRTTGWVGYTLSWANRRFAEINEGKSFRSRYDNRHKFNVVVMHKINPLMEITAAWSYASGNRTTLALERYVAVDEFDHNGEIEYVPERNNYQLPAYHRLDVGLNVYRPKPKNRMGIWNISIYNAYCRMNPFMVYQSHKNVGDLQVAQFKQMSYLPIIPMVSYTYKF